MTDEDADFRRKLKNLSKLGYFLLCGEICITVNGRVLSCHHPVTNEGFADEGYQVISVDGFRECDLWFFNGQMNIDNTLKRLKHLNVSYARISEMERIYLKAVYRIMLSPSFFIFNIVNILRLLSSKIVHR